MVCLSLSRNPTPETRDPNAMTPSREKRAATLSVLVGVSLLVIKFIADAQHPYGHGKIEFLSAGFEGGMILIASLVIAARVIQDFLHGPRVQDVDLGLWLMAAAMIINGAMGLYLTHTGRRHGSITLEA